MFRHTILSVDHIMTPEFEQLCNDPDLQAERGPGGTLIFVDGDGYCVIGPGFVCMEQGDWYAFGDSRQQALENYAAERRRAGHSRSAL